MKDKAQGGKEIGSAPLPEINGIFASIEQIGVRIGVVLVLAAFVLYATGAVTPFLSIEDLMLHWGARAVDFATETGYPTGWGWVPLLAHSDMMALGGLVLLTSVVAAAYLGIGVKLARARNRIYLLLVVLQLAVFALAASGLLEGGH